jgi:hypothetical protein
MRKEFFGGFVFVGLVFGVNYVLNHVLKELSDEDTKDKNGHIMEELFMEELEQSKQEKEEQEEQKDQEKEEQKEQQKQDDQGDQAILEQINQERENLPDQANLSIELLDSVIPMVSVLETKIRDDMDMVQKILERKRYLVNLNEKLVEIKDKLQELKNELVK